MFSPCIEVLSVISSFAVILVIGDERVGCFTLVVFLMPGDCL